MVHYSSQSVRLAGIGPHNELWALRCWWEHPSEAGGRDGQGVSQGGAEGGEARAGQSEMVSPRPVGKDQGVHFSQV